MACGATEMRVSFPGFPDAVQGLAPDDCKLNSRSPRKHVLRVGLSAARDGQRLDVDGPVKVTISNYERGLVIGKVDLKADGEPVEVTLDGPANPGEHLMLQGNYVVGGKLYEFDQKCHVD